MLQQDGAAGTAKWPCPPSPDPGLFQGLPIWVASFVKLVLGLALIIYFLIGLSMMELVRRARLTRHRRAPSTAASPLSGSELGQKRRAGTGSGCHSCGVGAGLGERRGCSGGWPRTHGRKPWGRASPSGGGPLVSG